MIESMIFALIAGIALGALFFFGLWWTVQKGLAADNPALWFIISFLLRMFIAISGFYWIAQLGQWQHLLVALLGFIVSRVCLSRFVTAYANKPSKEGHNAP